MFVAATRLLVAIITLAATTALVSAASYDIVLRSKHNPTDLRPWFLGRVTVPDSLIQPNAFVPFERFTAFDLTIDGARFNLPQDLPKIGPDRDIAPGLQFDAQRKPLEFRNPQRSFSRLKDLGLSIGSFGHPKLQFDETAPINTWAFGYSGYNRQGLVELKQAGTALPVPPRFQWRYGQPVTVSSNSLIQTVAGVTATAKGYAVECTAGTSRVFGPFPTRAGLKNLRTFGIDQRTSYSEPLGLLTQPFTQPLLPVKGGDVSGSLIRHGIDNYNYISGDRAQPKLEFVMFEFNRAVSVKAVTIDRVSNFGLDIWVAYGTTAPTFSNGLSRALSGYTVALKQATNGDLIDYRVDSPAVRYLMVGAPVPEGCRLSGVPSGRNGGTWRTQVMIDSVEFAP